MKPSRDPVSSNRSPSSDSPSARRESARPHAVSIADPPYPVLPACRRDVRTPAPAVDSKPAVARQVSEITIAAGVPLPLNARRVFTKVAGASALALLAGLLVFAFARQPTSAMAGPLSSNVSMVPRTVVTEASANPTRTQRGKVTEPEPAASARAGDTAAIAAVAVTTASPSPSAVRTARVTTPGKGKTQAASPMRNAKFVPEAGGHPKSAVLSVKHTTHRAPARPHAKPTSRAHAKAKASVKTSI